MDDRFIIERGKLIGYNLELEDDERYDIVDLPEGINEIAERAMSYYEGEPCSLTFPKNIKKIGEGAFEGSSELFYDGNLDLEEGLEEIGNNAFSDCGISNLYLPKGLKRIGAFAFSDNYIEEVIIPNTVEEIGMCAFGSPMGFRTQRESVKSVILEEGNPNFYIENGCLIEKKSEKIIFYFDDNATSVNIPKQIKSIGAWAFSFRENLKNIVLSVENVEFAAFLGCTNLTIEISEYVFKIEEAALCLTKDIIVSEYSRFEIENGCITDYINNKLVILATQDIKGEVQIPEYVDYIGKFAFAGRDKLRRVEFNKNGVREIGDYAFYNCTDLTRLHFKDGLEKIGRSAFEGCRFLMEVALPKSVEKIGTRAFRNSSLLDEVYLPYVQYVGSQVFGNDSVSVYREDLDAWVMVKDTHIFFAQYDKGYNWNDDWAESASPIKVHHLSRLKYEDNIPSLKTDRDWYDCRFHCELGEMVVIDEFDSYEDDIKYDSVYFEANTVNYDELLEKLVINIELESRNKNNYKYELTGIRLFYCNEETWEEYTDCIERDDEDISDGIVEIYLNETTDISLNPNGKFPPDYIYLQFDIISEDGDILSTVDACLIVSNKIGIIEPNIRQFSNSDILYIYKGSVKCHRDNHKILQATAIFHNEKDEEIKLNVEYCIRCDKFLLEYSLYERYREKFGAVIGNLRIAKSEDYSGEYQMALESPLYIIGYNVSQKTGFTKEERQYILARVLFERIMSKGDVIKYLSFFIRRNGMKDGNELAVTKWNEDLTFVQEYNINQQPSKPIKEVKRYKK